MIIKFESINLMEKVKIIKFQNNIKLFFFFFREKKQKKNKKVQKKKYILIKVRFYGN